MQIFIQGKDQRKAMDMREQLYMLEIEKHRGIKDAAQALQITEIVTAQSNVVAQNVKIVPVN